MVIVVVVIVVGGNRGVGCGGGQPHSHPIHQVMV